MNRDVMMPDEENPITDALWRFGSACGIAMLVGAILGILIWPACIAVEAVLNEELQSEVSVHGVAFTFLVLIPCPIAISGFVFEVPRRLSPRATMIVLPVAALFYAFAWLAYILPLAIFSAIGSGPG